MQEALAAEQNLGLPSTHALLDEAMRFAGLCDDYLRVPKHDLARVREHYVTALAALGALDFGGLQREAVGLLERDAETREAYQSAFRFILVDEYQDTNVAQDRLLELLAGERRNVFCVADEDQSIYGFRGAEIDNTLRFDERWPGTSRYDLPVNYRSAAPIVELATSVIRRNVETHLGKELRADQDRPAEIVGRTFRHAAEEADWIAREIAALRQEGVAARADRGARPVDQGDRPAARVHIPDARHLVPRPVRAAAAPERGRAPVAARAGGRVSMGAGARRRRAPRARLPPLRREPAGAAALSPRAADAVRRAARGGRFRAVLRGAGDRQASENRGRGDLRPLGPARALPRARVSGRDARADRGARRRDRALRRRQRVRRCAGRVPALVPRGRARARRLATGCAGAG